MLTGELNYFCELIEAFQDTGAYEHNPMITGATRRIKTGIVSLRTGLENEMVGPEPEKSMIVNAIRRGRKHEH